jgi:hypothetical protein
MATISEHPVLNSVFEGNAGILSPHLTNRFVLRFDVRSYHSTFSQDCFDFLSMQLIKVNLDLKNSSISLVLEQPLHNYEFFLVLLKELADMPDVTLQVLTSPGNPGDEPSVLLTLERCKLKTHDFVLEYAGSGSAKHNLTFKFDFRTIRDRIICQIHDIEKQREETMKNAVGLTDDNLTQPVTPQV